MGMDVFGHVEVQRPRGFRWRAVVDAGFLLDRDSGTFDCLLGMGGLLVFEPLFFARGWPEDCDARIREQGDADTVGATYFTLAELQAVDLDAGTRPPSTR